MKKSFIIIVILFFVLAGVLLLLDLPLFGKVSSARKEIVDYQQAITGKREVLNKVAQLREVWQNREEAINRAYYVLPEEEDKSGLIVQFEALASENGLVLEKIDFGRVKQEEKGSLKVKNLEINLNLEGDYLAFKSFLTALESNIRLMDLQALNFSSIKNQNGLTLFDFTLKLKAYFQ